uniref:Rhotekin 2 n=1 Tax=Caenorhabditis tropicalis TaxID=1561998 RepID=A0A1I7T860_9PELO
MEEGGRATLSKASSTAALFLLTGPSDFNLSSLKDRAQRKKTKRRSRQDMYYEGGFRTNKLSVLPSSENKEKVELEVHTDVASSEWLENLKLKFMINSKVSQASL